MTTNIQTIAAEVVRKLCIFGKHATMQEKDSDSIFASVFIPLDNIKLTLRNTKGKIEIHCSWNLEANLYDFVEWTESKWVGNTYITSERTMPKTASVSADRGADAVAKRILKELPEWCVIIRKAIENQKESQRKADIRNTIFDTVCLAFFNKTVPERERYGDEARGYVENANQVYIKIQSHGTDNIRLELNVTPEQAIRIATALRNQ